MAHTCYEKHFIVYVLAFCNYLDYLDAIAASPKSDHTLGYEEMALRIVVNSKDGEAPLTITLVAQTAHEKAAWISDLKQVTYYFCN